jgi:hypothetical protein
MSSPTGRAEKRSHPSRNQGVKLDARVRWRHEQVLMRRFENGWLFGGACGDEPLDQRGVEIRQNAHFCLAHSQRSG